MSADVTDKDCITVTVNCPACGEQQTFSSDPIPSEALEEMDHIRGPVQTEISFETVDCVCGTDCGDEVMQAVGAQTPESALVVPGGGN